MQSKKHLPPPHKPNRGKNTFSNLFTAAKETYLFLLGIVLIVIAWHIQTNQLSKTEDKLIDASRHWLNYKILFVDARIASLQTETLLLNRADSISRFKENLINSYLNEALAYLSLIKEGEGILEGRYKIPDSLKINFELTSRNIIQSYNQIGKDSNSFSKFYKGYLEIKDLFSLTHTMHQQFHNQYFFEETKKKEKQDKTYIYVYVVGIILIWLNKFKKYLRDKENNV